MHSRAEQRYRCTTCGQTFAATRGTPAYRLHHDQDLWADVLSLLAHGCPVQAIVATFGLDARTVATWQAPAGQHAQAIHEQVVAAGQVELGHVQADEMWIRLVGGRVWQAMALAVPSRLWLGGVISPTCDKALLRALLLLVLAAAASLSVLIGVDGLRSYVTVVQQVWRVPVRTGRRGRPRLVTPQAVLDTLPIYAPSASVAASAEAVEPSPSTPPVAAVQPPTNLPAQANPLVGRAREQTEVLALMRQEGTRLVTLTGPGGAGKTHLSLQVAGDLLGRVCKLQPE